MKKLLFLFTLLCLSQIFTACPNPEPDPLPPGPDPGEITIVDISGKVKLPDGYTQTGELHVVSPVNEVTVTGGDFQTTTIKDEIVTQFVYNNNEEPLLMGLTYPGQTNFTVDATSTVVAMLVNTPVFASLTTAGRIKAINDLQTDIKFNNAVIEVEKVLKSGKTLFDATNDDLAKALAEIFESFSKQKRGGWDDVIDKPVKIDKAGNLVSFTNAGVAHSYNGGVYNNSNRIHDFSLEGLQFFPNSIQEIINGYDGISGDPQSEIYNFPATDGEYNVKLRSGAPFSSDGSMESIKARRANLKTLISEYLKVLIPPMKTECGKKVKDLLEEEFETTINLAQYDWSSTTAAAAAVLDIALLATGYVETMDECVQFNSKGRGAMALFGKFMGGFLQFAQKKINIVSVALNTGTHLLTWNMCKPAIDTCFKMVNNKIIPCEPTLNGISFTNKQKIGEVCSQNFFSCDYDVVYSFSGSGSFIGGTIKFLTQWDSDGDGFYEGNKDANMGSALISKNNSLDNTVIQTMGFCWGGAETKLKLKYQYISPSGEESQIMEAEVPK